MALAMMFPGQGSQKVGMGVDLMADHPEVAERYFAVADEILGFDLTAMCTDGPEETLRSTENTQPAIFTVSVATLHVLRQAGIEPDVVAGHSLGEYSALVCAGALDFADALRLVRRRGELMAAVNERTPGAMAAIVGPSPTEIEELCAAAATASGSVVEPANYNDPTQTVISGEAAGVEAASLAAKESGARVIPLSVGAPFHCSLMESLADEFAETLDAAAIRDPQVPVIANVTAAPVTTAAAVRDALRRQVSGAVRWTETVQRLDADGVNVFVEVGPGRVLSGLVSKTLKAPATHATSDGRRLAKTLAAFE